MLKASQFLNKNLKDNDTIVIGVSGGPDSMALLNLAILCNKQIKIICAHINHNVRKESYEEAIMVENYCNKHNVIFKQMVIENYSDENFHNQARKKRYDFYEKLVNEYGAKYLLTAHHGDDLMETMLMRIVRGSTLSGYAGFSEIEKRDKYTIIRPLIHHTKDEILSYVIKNDIPYAVDASNEKDVYTRNRFRKYILPGLKKENTNVHDKFYDLSILLKESSEFISNVAEEKLKECYKDKKINLNYFKSYHDVIKREILKHILWEIYHDEIFLIKNSHINQILELTKANAELDLPKNVKINKSYDYITFDTNEIRADYFIEIKEQVQLPNGKALKVSKSVNDKSNNVIRLSSDEITLPLFVRNRKAGDKIVLKGLNQHKKVKDILINEKVPKIDRENIPIVVDKSGEIVWIPGLKKSKFDKSNTEKYDIIVKYI